MKLQRRAFVSTLASVAAGATLDGQQPSGQRAANQIGFPSVCLFGGLCLFARSANVATPSRVLLPNASTSELGMHKPVLQVPDKSTKASEAMLGRSKRESWGYEFDISDLEVILPGGGGVTELHKPTAKECPQTPADWNSMEWVADLKEIKSDVKLRNEHDGKDGQKGWRSIAHAAVRLSGGRLFALPPGRNTKGIWRWTTTNEMGQRRQVRQAITDSVLYAFVSQSAITFADLKTGNPLKGYSVTPSVPWMTVTHVSHQKAEKQGPGVTHLHLLDPLLDPPLKEAIVPTRDGDCDRADFLDAFDALSGMSLNRYGFALADPIQAWAIDKLLKMYYDILLDDYRDCPGMYVDV